MSNVSKLMSDILENGNLTQQEAAKLLNVTPMTVNRWKCGRMGAHKLSLEKLVQVRDYIKKGKR